MRLLLLVLVVIIGACRPTIHASSYDQSCSVHADCVAVVDGDACDPCACPSAAISRNDDDKFNADLNGTQCPPGLPFMENECGICREGDVFCVDGGCTFTASAGDSL